MRVISEKLFQKAGSHYFAISVQIVKLTEATAPIRGGTHNPHLLEFVDVLGGAIGFHAEIPKAHLLFFREIGKLRFEFANI